MTYFNNLGQGRVGWRSPSAGSTLSTSIYAVWNADTTSTVTTLGTGTFAAWNAEDVISSSQLSTSLSNVWQGGSSFPATNYSAITTSMTNLWKGDGNFIDSIGGLTGTSPSTSAPTFTTGKIGTSAFLFDGINDYIELPTGSLKFTGDFTISMWVNGSNWTSSRTLIANYDINNVGNKWNGWQIGVNTNGMVWFTQANNGVWNAGLSSSVPLVAGVWSLLTVTRTSTTSTIYINGSKVASVANTISIGYSTTNFPYIGSYRYLPGYPLQQCFLGSLDEIGIWSRGLTDSEVIGLYENGNGQPYPYTNNTTVALDSFGTSNGILKNGVTLTTGKIGDAFLFNGSNYVDLPMGVLNKTGDFSVSLWVYPTANTGNMQLISCGDGIKGWRIEYSSGNLFFWGHTSNATPSTQLGTGHSILLNTWTHVLITFKSGGQAKSYINGALTNSVTAATILYDNYSTYYLPLLGAQRYQNGFTVLADQRAFFTGKLDGVTLWNRELTSTDALAAYNSGNGNEYPFSNVTMTSSNDALGNYNGTNNGVTFTTGKTGTSAFSFNGSSNYIALPQTALNFNKGNSGQSIGDFSVSFWVNLNTGSGDYQTVISNWGSNGFGWQVLMFGGSFMFFAGDGSNGSTARIQHGVGLSKTNATNQWVHVVVTYTNQSQVKSYVNGVLTNTSSTIYQVRTNSRNNGIIGAWPQDGDNSGAKYWYLNGKLDAVTLWTKALTDAEASALYNNNTGLQYSFPASTTGYLSSYNDAIGSNHGTTPSSTLTGGVPGPTFTAGKIGQAFNFDGINDYVALPNNTFNTILGGDFSISMWVNTMSLSSYQTLFSNFKSDGGGVYHGIILGINSNQFRFQIYNNTTEVLLQAGFSITTNTWNHIVVTRKYSTGTKIYVNGSLNTSNTNVTNPDVVALMYANIGAYMNASGVPSGEYMSNNSKIDAVSVWNKELTETEVTDLYNSGNGKQYPY